MSFFPNKTCFLTIVRFCTFKFCLIAIISDFPSRLQLLYQQWLDHFVIPCYLASDLIVLREPETESDRAKWV